MNFEDLQKTWQESRPEAKITIDAGLLLKEVRRNQQQFRAAIFWRDTREAGVAFLLTVLFLYSGRRSHDWTDELLALACFGVGMFMVMDRFVQHKKRPVKNESLKACLQSSLHEVTHQIWLLRNIAWWYLLPIVLGLIIAHIVSFFHARHPGSPALIKLTMNLTVDLLLFWGIYWLNQFAVRKSLQPRREELESLLDGLE